MPVKEDAWATAEHMRVLVCFTCKKVEEIPDFLGHPDDDYMLDYVVQNHPDHQGQLYRLPIAIWLLPDAKKNLISQMTGGASGLDMFYSGFYDTHNTFKEDALICYKGHQQPKGQCPDFYSDKKKLKPDTKQERKELGLAPLKVGPQVYLCDFCPVKTYNDRKNREARGDD